MPFDLFVAIFHISKRTGDQKTIRFSSNSYFASYSAKKSYSAGLKLIDYKSK